MIPPVTVAIGLPASGRTARLLDRYRQVLRQAGRDGAVGRALWLAPTLRGAAAVRQALLHGGLEACLDPGVLTFDELADRVLTASGNRLRRISPSMQRALLARIVNRAVADNWLNALRESATRSGFVDLVADHLRELRRRGITADAYAQAAARLPGPSDQHLELARLYSEYARRLATATLCDREGHLWAARDLLAAGACPWPGKLELVAADGFAEFTPLQHDVLDGLAQRGAQLLISLLGEAIGGRGNAAANPDSRCAASKRQTPKHEEQGVRSREQTSPAAPSGSDAQDDDIGRADLFAKSEAVLAELVRRHPRAEVDRLPQRPSGWPALDHLNAHLFRNPRRAPPPSPQAIASLDRLEIVAAAGTHDEIVQVARRVKHRLVCDGARPGDLLVVFRSLGGVARRVREVFDEFGIPYALESGQPLLSAPLVRTLLALLRLDQEDWPYRRVVAVVTNSTLAALDDDARSAADRLVRELQIAEGRRTLLDRVEQLASLPLVDDDTEETAVEHRQKTAATALPALQQIATALDRLPTSASHTEWADALRQLSAELGCAPPTDEDAGSRDDEATLGPIAAENRAAWQRVTRALASLDRLATWLDEPPPTLPRSEILHVLVDLATHESLPEPHDEMGRVRVLSAATARTVRAKHVFLAGMSEQAFPSPERVGRLATDADYRRLGGGTSGRQADLSSGAVERSQEEMLLFFEVLTRASERITISYPALDERAQSLPPSPYVAEIESVLESGGTIRHAKPQLSPVADSSPLGSADWRVAAVHAAMEGKHTLLAGLLADRSAPLAGAIEAGLHAVQARAGRNEFSTVEGLVTSQAARDRLAKRFGPRHLWSPSQWEQYATCPYRFFLEHVLSLQPLGELTLETDFARRGSLLHRVLAAFHRRLRDAIGELRVPSRREEAEFQAEFKAAIAEALSDTTNAGLDAALLELDRRQIDRWAEGYYAQHAKYDREWTELDRPPAPAHFEVRFGPPLPGASEDDDPHSTSVPFVLELGDEQIQITGRIDRIDVGTAGGRTVFNVIDYKSGKKPSLKPADIESGQRLQLPLYVMAAQHLLLAADSATPLSAGYWTMQGGFDAKGSLKVSQCAAGELTPGDEWGGWESTVVERVAEFVHAIRHGDFPVYSQDDHCTGRCPFRTVCRIAQVRSLGKIWPPEQETTETTGDLPGHG